MKKILFILAALCAIACSNDTNTIYQFSAESNSGDLVNFAGWGESETGKFMDQMLSRNDPDYASNPDIL
ncbi:MAG: hypothetical protein K6A62_05665 [Bacteroidales bacterium]|nr:hypothetical protein [Bacteroidales bacterium]